MLQAEVQLLQVKRVVLWLSQVTAEQAEVQLLQVRDVKFSYHGYGSTQDIEHLYRNKEI